LCARGARRILAENKRFAAMRVLVVEDNDELSDLLGQGLRRAGYDVDRASDVATARTAVSSTRYAAVILDLGLPDGDGMSVLRELRRGSDSTPVLLLTARAGVQDRVAGLHAGADDYLVKPFAFDELLARLQALLRRPGQFLGSSLKLANLSFDTQSRQIMVDSASHILPAREADVLEHLLRRKGNVVSKKFLEDQIFGQSAEFGSNAVEVYVHRLRKHLTDFGAKVSIHTVRGVGYLIAEE
jgi:DNA-binding response OmpR family regulator